MLQQKFQLQSWELGVLQCKGAETAAIDYYDKHCRTKPKHQQPRQLRENCIANSCHFDLAWDSYVTLVSDKTSLLEQHLKLSFTVLLFF